MSGATRGRPVALPRYSGSCASSQRETFSLTSSPRFTSRGQVVSDKMVIEARREAHVDEGRKSYRSFLRFQLCANRRFIRKLDLSVLNLLHFFARRSQKNTTLRGSKETGEAVEIREVLTPLDLFRFLAPFSSLPLLSSSFFCLRVFLRFRLLGCPSFTRLGLRFTATHTERVDD